MGAVICISNRIETYISEKLVLLFVMVKIRTRKHANMVGLHPRGLVSLSAGQSVFFKYLLVMRYLRVGGDLIVLL